VLITRAPAPSGDRPIAAGHQPMEDPETGCWITYNGECYNFPELRKDLQSHGVRFRTTTDTEVILKAYGRWGKDFVRRLRGIFAFGIWDPAEERSCLPAISSGSSPYTCGRRAGGLFSPQRFGQSWPPDWWKENWSRMVSYLTWLMVRCRNPSRWFRA